MDRKICQYCGRKIIPTVDIKCPICGKSLKPFKLGSEK